MFCFPVCSKYLHGTEEERNVFFAHVNILCCLIQMNDLFSFSLLSRIVGMMAKEIYSTWRENIRVHKQRYALLLHACSGPPQWTTSCGLKKVLHAFAEAKDLHGVIGSYHIFLSGSKLEEWCFVSGGVRLSHVHVGAAFHWPLGWTVRHERELNSRDIQRKK